MRDHLQFSYFVASKPTVSQEFLMNLQICYLKIDVSCEASVNFHHISQNATPATEFAPLSPLHAALTMRFAKVRNTTCLEVLLLPRKMTNATHLLRTTQGYCSCHTKRLWTRYEKCWNDTKCHACRTKRGYATFETSKSDHSCKTRHRHGHTALTRPPVDGCERCGRSRS